MLKKLLLAGCTLLLLTACGTASEESVGGADQSGAVNETETNQKTDTTKGRDDDTLKEETASDIANPPISLTEAVDIFKEAHPNAKIESVELDDDDGRLHYDFEGFDSEKEYEMEIDAVTGKVKENEVDANRETDDFLDFSAVISPEKAIEIASAQDEVKGLKPTGWSLEADDGKQKYTIDYDKDDSDIDIKINAVSGEIIEVDLD